MWLIKMMFKKKWLIRCNNNTLAVIKQVSFKAILVFDTWFLPHKNFEKLTGMIFMTGNPECKAVVL